MFKKINFKQAGVTLIEILLVLVIASAILILLMNYIRQKTDQLRIDRTTQLINQILSAGAAYYTSNGTWPINATPPICGSPNTPTTDLSILQNNGYLPSGTIKNAWGGSFTFDCNDNIGVFYVTTTLPGVSPAVLSILAGGLPMGTYEVMTNSVTAQINIPKQSLNNAIAVNFSSVYNSGACVPAPTCPSGLVPQIMVVPVSVTGINDNPSTTSTNNVYAINSYTGFALGQPILSPGSLPVDLSSGNGIQSCDGSNPSESCCQTYDSSGQTCTQTISTGYYWRVCLAVSTKKGQVQPSSVAWGTVMGSVLAITRCAVQNEPTGAGWDVWQP